MQQCRGHSIHLSHSKHVSGMWWSEVNQMTERMQHKIHLLLVDHISWSLADCFCSVVMLVKKVFLSTCPELGGNPSPDEDHVIRLKTPWTASKWTLWFSDLNDDLSVLVFYTVTEATRKYLSFVIPVLYSLLFFFVFFLTVDLLIRFGIMD